KKLAVTDKSVTIVSQGAGLIIEVPKAKKSGGKYYLNKELLKHVRYNEFSSRGNKMAARVEGGDVKGFLQALHKETGLKFEVPIPEKNKNMTLDFLGVQSIYEATIRLIKKLYRLIYHREAPNIEIQPGEKDILGVMKKYLGSPGTIPGKARYYVTHAKNAVHKQDRLRSILNKKLTEIFKPLKNKKLRGEFEALAWAGDLEGTEYTAADLQAMGVRPVVATAYLKHRRFHRHVWRLLASHRKAYGGDTGHIKGHIPHLFENWNIYEVKDERIEGKAGNYKTLKTLGSIVGTFRSLRKATNFANGLNPDRKYVIRPKMFHMPDDFIRKTVLKDASYFRLIRTFEEQFDMTREEATQYVQGVTRRKNRRRFFGNLSERKGQTGFRQKDLHKILSQYYNSAARYITLDDFKARVIPRFEKDIGVDHGRARNAIRDKNLARYIERYIDDVGGVPTEIEDALNASIKSMPYVGKFMRSQRPAIWGINKLLHATSVLKLGVFNLSSGMVNLTQLTNTFAKVPTTHIAWAMKEAMRPWKLMKPGSRAILSRIGVPSDLGLADTGGYSVTHKGGKLVRASMIFFQGAEQLNRRVTGLAAYRWGRKSKGLSHRQALIFAREMIDNTQFDYSVADTAQAFRNPVGRLLGQFKPFAIKQIEFVTGLRGAENIKFWIPMLLLAGLNGIPMIEGASDLIEWLTGKNPLIKTKEFIIKWAGSDPQKKQAAEVAIYGVGSALGVDASKRVGIGDILPRRAGDLLGPSINTIRQAIRITKDGGDKTELVKTFAPSVGNFLTALETVLNDMQVKDPWHRQRLKYTATPSEMAIK
ncbi:MAG: hypothetical protein ACE5DR_05555, partial [Thermodesulfobacteriota bacterium]